LGLSYDLGLGVAFMPFLFLAHLSLGCNYAEFPYFYLKLLAGQCEDDKDLFWIAKVTDTNNKKVALCYYHYTINRNDEKIQTLQFHQKL
jgi:hypothetical protein